MSKRAEKDLARLQGTAPVKAKNEETYKFVRAHCKVEQDPSQVRACLCWVQQACTCVTFSRSCADGFPLPAETRVECAHESPGSISLQRGSVQVVCEI